MKAGCKTFLIMVELIIVFFICFNITNAETILFQDNFEDRNNFGWTTTIGEWDASLGYNEAIGLYNGRWAYTYAGNASWDNYTLDIDITFGTGNTEFIVAVRVDPSSFPELVGGKQYYLSVDGDDNVIRLRYTEEPSGFFDLQTVPYNLLDNETYHIKISIFNNNLIASIDGNPIFDYTFFGTTPIYSNGAIGVGYQSDDGPDSAFFDNVTVTTSQADEVWVDDDYCNSCPNDGHTWSLDAFAVIQDGIDAVTSPGTVNVAPGNYNETVTLKANNRLLGSGMNSTIIDGLGLFGNVVTMNSNTMISGFGIINGNAMGINSIYCGKVIIKNNLISNHVDSGIGLTGYHNENSIVSNNIITKCGAYGGIDGNTVVGSPQIINNTVIGNKSNGICFWYSGTPIIKNNIIVNNNENGIVVGGNITYGFAEPENSHNNAWNNTFPNWNNLTPGEGAISENPLFVNESSGDYHLQKDSPCIDAGTDVGLYVDMDGDVRPFGAGFDMGADEFVPGYIEVTLDIKPGSYLNSINLKSKGKVPVAILTTDDFDAQYVDPETCVFAGAEPLRWNMIDLGRDGDVDMILHFKMQELDLDQNSSEASLVCKTYDGIEIIGTDSVKIVPKCDWHCNKYKKHDKKTKKGKVDSKKVKMHGIIKKKTK